MLLFRFLLRREQRPLCNQHVKVVYEITTSMYSNLQIVCVASNFWKNSLFQEQCPVDCLVQRIAALSPSKETMIKN